MTKKISKLLLLLYILSFGLANSAENCRPEFQAPEIPMIISNNENSKNTVYVFYDGSLSMTGFTKSQPDETNLFRPINNDLQQISQSLGTETIYNTFGSRFETIDENRASIVTTEEFYKCTQSAQTCVARDKNNDLHKVLNGFSRDPDATYIIVTDLFLSTSEILGKNSIKIKKSLREIFKSGKSIGIFGFSSSYNGKISGIPTEGGLGSASYSDANKRPFYIIVIGSGENVNFVKIKLEKNQKLQNTINTDPEAYKFLWVTSNVILKNLNTNKEITEKNLINVNPESEGYKIEYDKNSLPIFRFKTSMGEKNIKFEFQKDKFIVPGSNGVAEYKIEEHLWSLRDPSCKKPNWGKATLKNLVEDDNTNKETLLLNFFFPDFKKSKIKWGYRYFILVNIYTQKNGTSSQDDYKDWNLTDDSAADYLQSKPNFFKTLNLMNLIEMFNDVANEEFKPTLVASLALDFDLDK